MVVALGLRASEFEAEKKTARRGQPPTACDMSLRGAVPLWISAGRGHRSEDRRGDASRKRGMPYHT